METGNYKIVREKSAYYEKQKITGSLTAAQILRPIFETYNHDLKEYFFILTLNRANQVTGGKLISMGSISASVVDIQEIAQIAILSKCSGLILCHNHPSGNLTPSDQDIQITKRVKQALELFDVKILDHIILAGDDLTKYYSFADEGRI